MRRPAGVTVIACFLLLWSACMCALAVILLAAPAMIVSSRLAPLARQFRLQPRWMLLAGVGWAFVSWGLLRLRNWARWITMAVLGVAVAAELPILLNFKIHPGWRVLVAAMDALFRAAAAIYLAQSEAVLDAFVFDRVERADVDRARPQSFR